MQRQTANILTALFCLALTAAPAAAQVVFSENFESPVVAGFKSNTVPTTGWIGATNGFGSDNRGLYNEVVTWPTTPPFTTPFGRQAYFINYTNSALTTAQGATGQTLTAGVPYKVAFHVAVTQGTASAGYLVELVAFGPTHDNTSRKNGQAGRVGTVLATASGTVTTSDMSQTGQIVFTANGTNASLGKEIGIRLVKSTGSMLYENIRLIAGHDYIPSPAFGMTALGGNVTLNWTNRPANTGSDVWVDIWYGTNPASLTKILNAGLNATSVVANVPASNTYYWRIDTYADGTPIQSSVFQFVVEDFDGDGLPDAYELANTTPPSATALNPGDDPDTDGLTNLLEYYYGTDPSNDDTDGDTLKDGPELTGVVSRPPTSPVKLDTDDDGLSDGVESNSGIWVSVTDTGTNPADADWDRDGLKDGIETKTGIFVGRTTDTGTDPYVTDSDNDGVGDWYEITAAFTNPNNPAEKPDVPYPLPRPVSSDLGAANKPVKVYIMAGQSNMVGIGNVNGTEPGTLETIAKRENKFPNLVDGSNNWTLRNDVIYKGVVSATAAGPLTAGQGAGNTQLGPELGFGQVMGWYHDEPVLLIKASQGNRSLGWDFLPPDSPRYVIGSKTYAGYGDSTQSWTTGSTPVPVNWYAGKQYDECFRNEANWPPAGAAYPAITNAYDILANGVLQNLPTTGNNLNGRTYEIAGFVWWQGHKDHMDAVYAPSYEQNLVNLINKLRADFNAPNAPFVVGSIGFGGGDISTKPALYKNVHNAQMAVGNPSLHPEFAGIVESVNTLPYWRTIAESPTNQDYHYNKNAETYMLVGDAMGRAMISLNNDLNPPNPGPVDHFVISSIGSIQTVGTPITGITITAQDSSNATATGFTGTVSFGGTGGFSGTSASFVAGVLSNVSVTPTVAGNNLTLTVNDGADHTGTTSIATIQSAYNGWSGSLGFNADSGGDGIANGLAWALGATDPSANATSLLPTFDNSSDADYFIYTYRRSDAANAAATVVSQYSTDLSSNWTPAVHDGTDVIITASDNFHGTNPGIDKVEVKIKRTMATDGKIFTRLSVTPAP